MDIADPSLARPSVGPWRRAFGRLLHKKIAVVCLVVIATFYIAGIFAPVLSPYDYADTDLDRSFVGPSWSHPLGHDRLGRDTLTRNLYAARTTVIVTAATMAAGFIILPLTLGMLAGYRRGWVDSLIMRTGEILSSLPGLPMLVLINATLRPKFVDLVQRVEGWLPGVACTVTGSGGDERCRPLTDTGFADYFLIFFVLSLFGWVGGARLVRTQVLVLRDSEYVLSARSSGASTKRILFGHILPNILPLVVVGASASLGGIALTEIGLTFLGVGIQPPHPSFGALITDGASRTVLENHPQLLLVPAITVGSLVFAFNLLGDALSDILTPRAR